MIKSFLPHSRWDLLCFWRWRRSSWIVAALATLAMLLVNFPAQVVHFPRVELSNSLQGTFPIDWHYEHGWPWTYLERANFDHTASMHMPQLWDDPSASACWTLWSDLPELHLGPLLADATVMLGVIYFSAVLFESWRRRRNHLWQLHLLDVFGILTAICAALAVSVAHYHRMSEEKRLIGIHEAFAAGNEELFSEHLFQTCDVQPGGPSWLRLQSHDSLLSLFDRIVAGSLYTSELPKIESCSALRALEISYGATPDDLKTLEQFPRLETLRLYGVSVSDRVQGSSEAPVFELPSLPGLRGLSIAFIDISDKPIAGLSQLHSLEVLELDRVAVDENTLQEISGLPRLRELSLNEVRIISAHLEDLAHLSRLERLVFDQVAIDDRGLKHLSHLDRLTDLSLLETNVTAKGLIHLADLPNLTSLKLEDVPIGDRDVLLLGKFARLRRLTIDNSQISVAGIAALKEGLRNCEIMVLEGLVPSGKRWEEDINDPFGP